CCASRRGRVDADPCRAFRHRLRISLAVAALILLLSHSGDPPMPTTDRGLLALARHEGVVPAPYLDVKRVWTFGIGHTAAAGAPGPAWMTSGMPADLDAGVREAFRLFRADRGRDEAEVLRAVTVPRAASSMRSSPSITTPARSP